MEKTQIGSKRFTPIYQLPSHAKNGKKGEITCLSQFSFHLYKRLGPSWKTAHCHTANKTVSRHAAIYSHTVWHFRTLATKIPVQESKTLLSTNASSHNTLYKGLPLHRACTSYIVCSKLGGAFNILINFFSWFVSVFFLLEKIGSKIPSTMKQSYRAFFIGEVGPITLHCARLCSDFF